MRLPSEIERAATRNPLAAYALAAAYVAGARRCRQLGFGRAIAHRYLTHAAACRQIGASR